MVGAWVASTQAPHPQKPRFSAQNRSERLDFCSGCYCVSKCILFNNLNTYKRWEPCVTRTTSLYTRSLKTGLNQRFPVIKVVAMEKNSNDESASHCLGSEDCDPDPISLILEIANLIVQPGSLALIAAGTTAVINYKNYKNTTEGQRSKIRGKLYEIDRAINDGFSALMILASLLDQFNSLEKNMKIGGAPIRGYKNAQKLRRSHEDCRSAVKEARDAFIELSEILPADHALHIGNAIGNLNLLYQPLISFESQYGRSLVAATLALQEVDSLICKLGVGYDFHRSPRPYTDELVKSIPMLTKHREKLLDLNFLK